MRSPTLTLGDIAAMLDKNPIDTPVFVATATGTIRRNVVSIHSQGGAVILACAPPSFPKWVDDVDWTMSNRAIAINVGISRLAVTRMRKRRFGVSSLKAFRKRKKPNSGNHPDE